MEKNNSIRPVIKIPLTPIDILIEMGVWVTLLVLWWFVIMYFDNLPNKIPTHFDFTGKIDSYGSKSSLWGLPLMASIIIIGISILNRFPHIFNYPTTITPTNAYSLYASATRLLRVLKWSIAIIFLFIAIMVIQKATGSNADLGQWIMPTVLFIVIMPVIVFLIYVSKQRLKEK